MEILLNTKLKPLNKLLENVEIRCVSNIKCLNLFVDKLNTTFQKQKPSTVDFNMFKMC